MEWVLWVFLGPWKLFRAIISSIAAILKLREWAPWFWPASKNRIAVFGIGGTGKTTLAMTLARSLGPTGATGRYKQSFGIERHTYTDGKPYLLLVAPGQESRRDTWDDVLEDVRKGAALGVIHVVCYGHQTFLDAYRKHKLYTYSTMEKNKFLEAYCSARLEEEVMALASLRDGLKTAPGPIWMVTVVVKQDLWFSRELEVRKHYEQGEYAAEIAELKAAMGKRFRHEYVYASLAIVN